MKKLQDVKGVKRLNKNEQRSINGGIDLCRVIQCVPEYVCDREKGCVPRQKPWEI